MPEIPTMSLGELPTPARKRVEQLGPLPWHCPWEDEDGEIEAAGINNPPKAGDKVWVVISIGGGYPIGGTFPTEATANNFAKPASWSDLEWRLVHKVEFTIPKDSDQDREMCWPMAHEWFTPFEDIFDDPFDYEDVDHWVLHAVLKPKNNEHGEDDGFGGRVWASNRIETSADAIILTKNGMHSLGYPMYRRYGVEVERDRRDRDAQRYARYKDPDQPNLDRAQSINPPDA